MDPDSLSDPDPDPRKRTAPGILFNGNMEISEKYRIRIFRIRIRIQSNIYVATGKEIKFGSGPTFGTDPNLYGKEPVPGKDFEKKQSIRSRDPHLGWIRLRIRDPFSGLLDC